MPIGLFSKCLQGDIKFVSRTGYYTEKKLRRAWASLFDQYIAVHGLPDSYRDYVKKMTKAIGFYEQAYSGKKWQVVKARVLEAEAEQILNGGSGESIETTCARISKYMGFPVRATECSVTEFYSYVAILRSN